MRTIYCLILILCPHLINSQRPAPMVNGKSSTIIPLTIGDTLPDISLKQMVNNKWSTGKLSQLKGKLIILDFWATWCSNCISEFPKMQSLQQQFDSSISIVLVNSLSSGDTETKLSHFAAKYLADRHTAFTLPTIVYDSVLTAYFPHTSLPHTVWIQNNKVIAITGADELSKKNIQAILGNKPLQMLQKEDRLNSDPAKPLLNLAELKKNELRSSFVLTSYVPGLNQWIGRYTDTVLGLQRRYYINQPLLSLYQLAAPEIPPFRFQVQLSGSNQELFSPAAESANSHKFCCEITLPVQTSKQQWQNRMLIGLNTEFDLHTEIKNLPTPCFVLTGNGYESKINKTPQVKKYKNITIWVQAVNRQQWMQDAASSIINETNLGSNTPVWLPNPSGMNLPTLSVALSKLGFSLVPATRNLSWMMITPAAGSAAITKINSPKN